MPQESRRLAGVLLIVLPTVVFGGASLLTMLINDPAYQANPLRQDLWRAGHAHAGVLLLLSLIALRYVDEAVLGSRARSFARHAIPAAAILLPVAFFLSVLSPGRHQRNPPADRLLRASKTHDLPPDGPRSANNAPLTVTLTRMNLILLGRDRRHVVQPLEAWMV